jgi:pro-sigmaK processing inhibitor BofA
MPAELSWTDFGAWTMEKILNVVMRGILGTIAMYFINSLLGGIGLPLGVGINAATVLTSGILGFPGLLALYGIGIYRIL